jgi:DNA-directed RNA polymerase specialized sigma24 family protein
MTKDEMYFKYLPQLKKIASKYQDGDDMLSSFYLKLQRANISGVMKPANFISKAFKNHCCSFLSKKKEALFSEDIVVEEMDLLFNKYDERKEPTPEDLLVQKEAIEVYKKVAKDILHPKQHLIFCAVLDASIEDHSESRKLAAKKLGVTKNLIKVTMHSCIKKLTKNNFNAKLNAYGYGLT